MRIGPATRLAVNVELRVGAVIGSLVGTDTALVADCGLLDRSGTVDSGSGKSKIDGYRADGWTDDEVSWQHRTVSSGCIAGRIEISYKDHDTLGARGGGKMAEVAEWPTSARVEVVDIPF